MGIRSEMQAFLGLASLGSVQRWDKVLEYLAAVNYSGRKKEVYCP